MKRVWFKVIPWDPQWAKVRWPISAKTANSSWNTTKHSWTKKHNKHFFKHNTVLSKHNTSLPKHTTDYWNTTQYYQNKTKYLQNTTQFSQKTTEYLRNTTQNSPDYVMQHLLPYIAWTHHYSTALCYPCMCQSVARMDVVFSALNCWEELEGNSPILP